MDKVEINVSTITLSSQLPNCTINLTNVGKYLEIDEIIIGIKYNFANLNVLKGKYCTTVYKKSKVKCEEKINRNLFYNQVSIIVNNQGNHINVKLFGNGSLHLTGCRAVSEGAEVTRLLYNKLSALRDATNSIILSKDVNGVLLDKDNLIYSYDTNQIIGYCNVHLPNTYCIGNKEYDIDRKTGLFISKKLETQRRRKLLDLNGRVAGVCSLDLIKNKKKFYRKNSNIWIDYQNSLIYYDNELIIGRLVYSLEGVKDNSSCEDVVEIEYGCCPFVQRTYTIPTSIPVDINCINVYFNINMKINRQRFYECLLHANYICKYSPESYSGIKLLYKISKDESETRAYGICYCNSQCTCSNITFLIFQSGNVIATGFKQEHHVESVTRDFLRICTMFQETIKQKTI
jgi:TATA-box binding protein (TBP) (component of TFIID and TFIIIB)